MQILLTVVAGYLSYEHTMIHTKAFTEILVHAGGVEKLAEAVSSRVEEIQKSWPKNAPGYQNIISVSHSVIS